MLGVCGLFGVGFAFLCVLASFKTGAVLGVPFVVLRSVPSFPLVLVLLSWGFAGGGCSLHPPLVHPPRDGRSDQIARNHEENIDPDQATRKTRESRVKKHDRGDGQGSQSINVGSVFHLWARWFSGGAVVATAA